MPTIPCACGGMTNTAVSEHMMIFDDSNHATSCYAKWVDDKWVRGCGYNNADAFMKMIVGGMISEYQGVGKSG